jgi:hypothetical protein
MGLLTPDQVKQRLGSVNSFGRTEFYAELRYSSDAVRAAFDGPFGGAPSETQYQQAGRSALGALLFGDEGREFQKRLAGDKWDAVIQDGNRANFPQILGGAAGTPDLEAAGGVFTAITSWASAMVAAGDALRAVDGLIGKGPVAPDDPKLTAARELLKKRLTDVVAHTAEEFGDPLGMVMFYLAANQDAAKTVIVTGDNGLRIELP